MIILWYLICFAGIYYLLKQNLYGNPAKSVVSASNKQLISNIAAIEMQIQAYNHG